LAEGADLLRANLGAVGVRGVFEQHETVPVRQIAQSFDVGRDTPQVRCHDGDRLRRDFVGHVVH
jgi:hypothetical protein